MAKITDSDKVQFAMSINQLLQRLDFMSNQYDLSSEQREALRDTRNLLESSKQTFPNEEVPYSN